MKRVFVVFYWNWNWTRVHLIKFILGAFSWMTHKECVCVCVCIYVLLLLINICVCYMLKDSNEKELERETRRRNRNSFCFLFFSCKWIYCCDWRRNCCLKSDAVNLNICQKDNRFQGKQTTITKKKKFENIV